MIFEYSLDRWFVRVDLLAHMNAERGKNESFEDYKLRQREEKQKLKEQKRGTLVHVSTNILYDTFGHPMKALKVDPFRGRVFEKDAL